MPRNFAVLAFRSCSSPRPDNCACITRSQPNPNCAPKRVCHCPDRGLAAARRQGRGRTPQIDLRFVVIKPGAHCRDLAERRSAASVRDCLPQGADEESDQASQSPSSLVTRRQLIRYALCCTTAAISLILTVWSPIPKSDPLARAAFAAIRRRIALTDAQAALAEKLATSACGMGRAADC